MTRTMFFFLLSVLITFFSISNGKSLESFKTCYDLQKYVTANAIKRVGPRGLGYPTWRHRYSSSFQPRFVFKSLPKATTTSSSLSGARSTPVEGVDFSGTNVQVSGVDEPDIVKTDGKRVFAISKKKFYHVVLGRRGESGKVVASLTLPTTPRDMLFKGDSVVVISQDYKSIKISPYYPKSLPSFIFYINLIDPITRRKPVTALYRIDVSRNGAKIVDTTRIDGRYISGRAVDDVARIVTTYDSSNFLPLIHETDGLYYRKAKIVNRAIIQESNVSTWLPTYEATGTACYNSRWCRPYKKTGVLGTCTSTYYPKGPFCGFSFLTVSTVSLTGPLIPKGVSIIADGDTVYANVESLYVATTEYRWDFGPSRILSKYETSFHKFALGSTIAKYVASGEVSGSVLNQFSMHEYKDVFFVATTDGAPWWGARDLSASKVSSFKVVKKQLAKIGEVGGLGRGERIYAVRYIKDTAYVVTFRQVDPLYIVDLSNPYYPRVTGELKIPGYSAYLHPISPGRILGVGREATPQGRTTGAKVSLFDVSDVTKPEELSSWTLKGSYTSAEWEHLAFLYWAPEKLAVLPLSVYSSATKEYFRGSIVLEVSDKGIKERGRIQHTCCGSKWEYTIRRNFVIEKFFLWSLSYNALQVNEIKSLKKKSVLELK